MNKADSNNGEQNDSLGSKGMVYYTFFDTVSYIYSFAGDSDETFGENCEGAASVLSDYHRLFDIYHEYSGVVNLCTLNKNAGGDWMQTDERLVDFLLYSKDLYKRTNGEMNVMMGAVLRLWHDCRDEASKTPSSAKIPSPETLAEASMHTSIELLEIDEERNAVRITDPRASIDVGAVGKGYATEKAAEHLRTAGVDSYVLNIGGNIKIVGDKPDGTGWKTGIKNPADPDTYVSYITISDTSCVTSGNYERYFTVGGVRYHHIIDSDTLMPAEHFASVSVITYDSAIADALSTALFCMSYEDGKALLEGFENVEVIWITSDGAQLTTDGYSSLIVKSDETTN